MFYKKVLGRKPSERWAIAEHEIQFRKRQSVIPKMIMDMDINIHVVKWKSYKHMKSWDI